MSIFGKIKLFVGLQVYQMKSGIFITYSKCIKELLKTFGMEESRPMSTPMSIGHNLSKNDESSDVNQTLYRSVIGKLQYVDLILH